MQGGKKISTREFQNLIGRAGRSGYHTEGGIIFTDPKIYDKRWTWRGREKWADTLKLLDFNNAEDCLSSLIEIITPFKITKGEDDLLEFIANPKEQKEAWIEWCQHNELTSADDLKNVVTDLNNKEQILHSIESYFLSMLKDDNTMLSKENFLGVAHETLAYHLANEDEKERLLAVFSAIHARLCQVPAEKFPYYGRTLLGLDQLRHVESWIEDNLFELELCDSAQDILQVCWPLICTLSTSKIILNVHPQEKAIDIASRWCLGNSYHELHQFAKKNKLKVKAKDTLYSITQEHVVDFCSALSYDGMLLVGALGDIVEGRSMNETILTYTRSLQNQLKLGLSDELHTWLHSQGFADREVCKFISLGLSGARENNNIIDYKILKNNKQLLTDILTKLPSAFSGTRSSIT